MAFVQKLFVHKADSDVYLAHHPETESSVFERILNQLREKIRTRQYVMTVHADDEMDEDGLTIFKGNYDLRYLRQKRSRNPLHDAQLR